MRTLLRTRWRARQLGHEVLIRPAFVQCVQAESHAAGGAGTAYRTWCGAGAGTCVSSGITLRYELAYRLWARSWSASSCLASLSWGSSAEASPRGHTTTRPVRAVWLLDAGRALRAVRAVRAASCGLCGPARWWGDVKAGSRGCRWLQAGCVLRARTRGAEEGAANGGGWVGGGREVRETCTVGGLEGGFHGGGLAVRSHFSQHATPALVSLCQVPNHSPALTCALLRCTHTHAQMCSSRLPPAPTPTL